MNNELIERMNKVSARSLDGNVVMDSKEWNAIVELVSAALSQDRMPTNISGFGVVTVGDSFDGYDDDENGGDIHTAGINVGKWGNRIEIYGKGKDAAAEAEVLRDIILAALSQAEPVASVPQDVEEFVLHNSFSTAFYDEPQYVILTSIFEAWMAGHARVPVEPTYEDMQSMIDAGIKSTSAKVTRNECLMIYAAMLTRQCNLLTASKESEQS